MAKRRSRERRAVSFRMLAYRIVIVSRVKTRVIWVNGIRPKKKINAERAEETQRKQRREQGEKRKAKSEKRKAKSEKRKAKSEKRKAKSEKRKAKSEKRKAKSGHPR